MNENDHQDHQAEEAGRERHAPPRAPLSMPRQDLDSDLGRRMMERLPALAPLLVRREQ